jgi:hypothetical protein
VRNERGMTTLACAIGDIFYSLIGYGKVAGKDGVV